MANLMRYLSRRKSLFLKANESALKKTFNTYDLIFLGVGSTLGVGIYILSGRVAKDVAGPAISLSFLIAAITSVFAGLCYAEFGACSPSSGSIYSYCYATLGEFVAFIMGWNLLTEYVIGTASVVKALSVYLDSFVNHTIETHLRQIYEIDVPYLAEYFDVLAFLICILFAVILSFGLKESVIANNILTGVNISLVIFFIIIGLSKVNLVYWELPNSVVPPNAGVGGFFPYGISGVIQGAGICFYGFIGFDSIVTTGGEVKNPEKTLPKAILTSLCIIFLAYLSISTILTLLLPYYLQNETSPLSYAFQFVGYKWAEWVINVGSLFGLCTSLFGAFFPISRILLAMSNDGLIFRSLGIINKKYNTPIVGTIFSGVVTGLTAALLDVDHLISLNSIGTLLGYTTIALCVIILRYSSNLNEIDSPESSPLLLQNNEKMALFQTEMYLWKPETRHVKTNHLVSLCMAIFCVLSVLLNMILVGNIPLRVYIIFLILLVMTVLLIIVKIQPSYADSRSMPFKMPWVPFLPALGICLNIFLMAQFDFYTWIRFGFWLTIGFAIYFTYGMFRSNEKLVRGKNM